MHKFAVTAAIEGPERLDRMRLNAGRKLPRLTPQPARDDTVAIVGFGPSLRQTWREIKTPHIITTSGAHDFLIERGRRPTWHVEFDPRPHKAFFLQRPHLDVIYLLASQCNPNLFDQLAGNKVMLWHGMGGDGLDDADLVIEKEGDDGILLFGGSNAGLRAFLIGHVLGFRRFELFGLDCSYVEDATWAGPHSGEAHTKFIVECSGRRFLTGDVMINAAEELFAFINGLDGCQVTIHGDHLFSARMQLMMKDRDAARGRWWKPVGFELQRAPLFPGVAETDDLISAEYRELNHRLHLEEPSYGVHGVNFASQVKMLMRLVGSGDVLDYGCGKCTLQLALGAPIQNYDPAIPEHAALPRDADIVVCTNTLEHVEPASLAAVLDHIKMLTRRVLYLQVATVAAQKTLADGRNTHQIVNDSQWWIGILSDWFDFLWPPMVMQNQFIACCLPKTD